MLREWTEEELRVLNDYYGILDFGTLEFLFRPRERAEIIRKAKSLGLKRSVRCNSRIQTRKHRFHFTAGQEEEILRHYPVVSTRELAERYGCSTGCVYRLANRHGIKKELEFIRETARRNFTPDHPARRWWIKKGTTPPNRGKKMEEYMSPEAASRFRANTYRKGHKPHNTRHDLFISERAGKNGHTYKWIRIAEGRWVLYHRYLWEKAYGEIPPGHNIQFRDGNSLNCTIDNLYMIGRPEQMGRENSFHARYPQEVKQLIHLKSVLKRQLNKHQKDEEQ